MFSLAAQSNRQEPAQMAKTLPGVSCNGLPACQSSYQTSALSPRFVVVRQNHNPSPSSPRSRTSWSGPGFFFARSASQPTANPACANRRASSSVRLAPTQDPRTELRVNTTDLGDGTCNSRNSLQGLQSLPCLLAANGTTSSAQAQAQPPARSLPVLPMAMCLPVRPSVPGPGPFAMMWARAEAKADQQTHVVFDIEIEGVQLSAPLQDMPAGGSSIGGFFVANPRGYAPHTHEEGTGYVQ
ncbi:hypothetical protein XMM379_000442 [Aliiroseovarius sp. xm-m-379]|nr:hypothetical protein [Aliiroseovarius sp. xm-d-517]NRP23769.1 hypothetical protein [Aliiroseovarius sp. xm-m-379]NRP28985.1 hypothetical protein [Aliiroseovarius sp. xm-m-314]NRP32568.1 hypothetical protein [Aliiroseovarius sp. xm-a-104]NRP41101.1 hypothetical protein [Aliiroseovarius sp. xm-m-339-2]NRP43709.1 hypothetical protein [Aliiroseovarius sp. xm-m-378]NRP48989.1 hypothetical protein [Aliiroseovarius sp. xm-m-354]NRP61862.1 hypothetical protein [Aliiroseovarius sp. xm-a-151]NRP64